MYHVPPTLYVVKPLRRRDTKVVQIHRYTMKKVINYIVRSKILKKIPREKRLIYISDIMNLSYHTVYAWSVGRRTPKDAMIDAVMGKFGLDELPGKK